MLHSKKYNLLAVFLILLSEVVCFWITRIFLTSYDNQKIYNSSMNIVQGLYFLPILLISIYFFFNNKSERTILIHSIISLIVYSAILHFFIKQISSLFTNINGIINFVEYALKIYFICLPLLSFRILAFFKLTIKNLYFSLFIRITLLTLITFLFTIWFGLKGILYAWSLNELMLFIIALIYLNKKYYNFINID